MENKTRRLRNWQKTKFTSLVRITPHFKQFLKDNKKGRQSAAGFLNIILGEYEKKLLKEKDNDKK